MADIEETVQAAKAFLLKSENGEPSTYDHMVNVLKTILTQRPDNVLNNFENISRSAKSDAFKGDNDRLQPDDVKSDAFEVSTKQKSLFIKGEEEENEDIYEGECVLPNILELANHFEETGINLGRDETFRIYLALKKLTEQYPLATCHFWGKIQGTKANYIIAQTSFRDGTDEQEDEEEAAEEEEEENHEDDDEEKEDALPVSTWKPPMVIPTEDRGAGANKNVYFVCNRPGDEWVRLPDVTPAQLTCARKIRKMFTGDLTTKICSYPPFPGDESNYLRAQIARISAGTHISPLGYYQFDEEDEGEEEDEEGKTDFIENPEFEGIPVRDLADPSLANWVHHVLHILPQGRTSWYNTNQKTEDAEEEEEEEVEVQDEAEPEIGPSLLTSISEDVEVDNMPAWTARISSTIIHPNHSLAVLKSNLWVGATTFCNGKRFENIYIGWGQKYIADNYSPSAPPKFEQEFIVGAEVTEIEDPTVEEEQAFKKAQEEELMAAEEMEEEDDDEDDDA
jgi:radial spoke head protein 4A